MFLKILQDLSTSCVVSDFKNNLSRMSLQRYKTKQLNFHIFFLLKVHKNIEERERERKKNK